jgi:hypothetical protein
MQNRRMNTLNLFSQKATAKHEISSERAVSAALLATKPGRKALAL